MSSRRNALVFMLAAVLAFAAASSSPAGARAATFDLDACEAIQLGKLWWSDQDDHFGFGMERSCPVRIRLALVVESNSAEPSFWKLQPPSGMRALTVSRFRFEGRGSNGSGAGAELGMRACGPSGCGTFLSVGSDSVTEPEQVDSLGEAAAIPPDATDVHLFARCASPPCLPERHLDLSNIQVTFDDPTAPELSLPTPVDGELKPLAWHSADSEVRFAATDAGGGIDKITATSSRSDFSTAALPTIEELCGIDLRFVYRFCPTTVSSKIKVGLRSAPTLFSEGANTVRIRAHDAAGQQSVERSVSFKVDRVPPGAPKGLTAAGEFSPGWTNAAGVEVSWTNPDRTASPAYESGVIAAILDLKPLDAGLSDPAAQRVDKTWIDRATVSIPSVGRWLLTVKTVDAAGNTSLESELTIGRDDTIPGPPILPQLGWVNNDFLIAATPIEWGRPGNHSAVRSGICGYALSVDTAPEGDPGSTLDALGDVVSAPLPQPPDAGEAYLHARAVSCSGQLGEVAHRRFDVDVTPPTATAHLDGVAFGWIGASDGLRIEGSDDGSGIGGVHHGFGESGAMEFEPAFVVRPLLAEGDQTVRFYARDVAGNTSNEESVSVRVDLSAPVAALAPQDPTKPTLITANISDQLSGIDRATLRAKRIDDPSAEWFDLGAPEIVAAGSRQLTMSRRFPDTKLPPGRYQLEVVAVDRVGHTISSGIRDDGLPAIVESPMRSKPTISITAPGYATTRTPKPTRIEGMITSSDGSPITGAEVVLSQQVKWREGFTRLASVRTDRAGIFSATLPPGPNRVIWAQYGATETTLEVSAKTEPLLTQTRIRFSANRKTVKRGRSIRLSGKIDLHGVVLPTGAKRVDFEFLTSRGWRRINEGDYTYTDSLGRFKRRLLMPAKLRRSKRFQIKAVAKTDSKDWGFVDSESRRITVKVIR